jgi:pimeloyl-ACP methyl ester carboxylesterase
VPAAKPFRHSQITVADASLHVVEAGDAEAPPMLFLHGWPESWQCWEHLMRLAARDVRAIAIDLPGIGGSTGNATDGSKRQLADLVHQLIATMNLTDVTLVGQDVGGMVTYAYLCAYQDLRRAVIMNVAIPGIDPWDQILRNPHLWHFALHNIPGLPELLVQGRQAAYFDFFYQALSPHPGRIEPPARAAYAAAYARDDALTAGFNWYRTMGQDAKDNLAAGPPSGSTPLLYLRGAGEQVDIRQYLKGFKAAGVTRLHHKLVPDAGHFSQEDAVRATWQVLSEFAVPPAAGPRAARSTAGPAKKAPAKKAPAKKAARKAAPAKRAAPARKAVPAKATKKATKKARAAR